MSALSVPEMIGMLAYFELCNPSVDNLGIELVTITFCSDFTGYLTANLGESSTQDPLMRRYCGFTSEHELRALLVGGRPPVWTHQLAARA
jgi:hypothetical protein